MLRPLLFVVSVFFSVPGLAQPGKDAHSLAVEGVQQLDLGNYETGVKLLKQARIAEPENYDYTLEIGRGYMLQKEFKKAEKYLYPLQYHANVQSDLYILLADCYHELDAVKAKPDQERKKELDALRYGIQKLPNDGILYLELGKRNLEMDRPIEALATLETGIGKAPNFSENYFWASKLMKASGNYLWGWIYAETCFNMTDEPELKRSSAILLSECSDKVLNTDWRPDPEKLDTDLKFILTDKCSGNAGKHVLSQTEKRNCLLQNWAYGEYTISPLFDRMRLFGQKGWLEAYLASITQETDRESFLKWLATNGPTYEEYRVWSYWNPLTLQSAVTRFAP